MHSLVQGELTTMPGAQRGSSRGLMSGQPQTPQGGGPGPGGHGQSQKRSVVVETSGRYERLEREGCSEKEDKHGRLEHNKDSKVTLSHPIRILLHAALSNSCQKNGGQRLREGR